MPHKKMKFKGGARPSKGPAAEAEDPQQRKVSNISKQIRDYNRLLSKDNLDSRMRKNLMKRVEELQSKQKEQKRSEKERKLSARYHMVMFFEKKKLERSMSKLQRNAEKSGNPMSEDDKQRLEQLKSDLQYVTNYPKGEKYVSILKQAETEEAQAVLDKERARIRALVRQKLADEAMIADADEGLPQKAPAPLEETHEKVTVSAKRNPELSTAVSRQPKRAKTASHISMDFKNHEEDYGNKAEKIATGASSPSQELRVDPREQNLTNAELATENIALDIPPKKASAFDDDFFLGSEDEASEPVRLEAHKLEEATTNAGEMPTQPSNRRHHKPRNWSRPQSKPKTFSKPTSRKEGHGLQSHRFDKKQAPRLSESSAKTTADSKPQRTRAEGGRKRRKK